MPTLAPPPAAAPQTAPARRFPPVPPRPNRGKPTPAMLAGAGDPADGTRMTRAAFLARSREYRAEWVDGRLDYLPMPRDFHSRLCSIIYNLLYDHLKAVRPDADLRGATIYVHCPRQSREPDAALLLDPHDPRRGPEGWDGADLCVEVVSPDDPDRDHAEKRADYAAAGVTEYWIVDPRPKTPRDRRGRTVTVLILDNGAYRERVFEEGETAAGELLPGLTADVTACLNAA